MFHKTSLYLAVALLMGTVSLSAQTATPKYGHMNLGNVLEQLPETKKANESLKAFTEKLSAVDDSLNQSFQKAYKQLEDEYKAGGLTPVQVQTREAQLQKQQESIQAFEQDAQKQVASRREELLKPILTTIEEAIKAVAKENGYMMIFDTSSGAMLFAADTEDVTPLVKKKMGI